MVSPPPRRYAAVVVLELDDGMLLALLNLYVFKCNEVSVLYTAACQPNALARSFSFGAPLVLIEQPTLDTTLDTLFGAKGELEFLLTALLLSCSIYTYSILQK